MICSHLTGCYEREILIGLPFGINGTDIPFQTLMGASAKGNGFTGSAYTWRVDQIVSRRIDFTQFLINPSPALFERL